MSEELKLDRYEVTEGGGTFKCPGGEMVYYSDVKSFIADNNAALRAELVALKAGQGEAVAYVLFRDGAVCYEADDNIVISNVPGDETDLYKWRPVYTAPPASADAVSVSVDLLELEWLEGWLRFAAEPIGQECCGRGGQECCGCPDPVYPCLEDVGRAMDERAKELRALLAQSESEVRP